MDSSITEPLTKVEHIKRDGLSNLQVIAYSMGLIGNDLLGTMWFSYFSYYLKDIAGVPGDIVGAAILIG